MRRAWILAIALALAPAPRTALASPAEVDSLRAQVRSRRFAPADSLGQKVIGEFESRADTASIELAGVQDLVLEGRLVRSSVRDSASRALAERSVRIRQRLQPGSPELATSLEQLAGVLGVLFDFPPAIAAQTGARRIRERSNDASGLARNLNGVGRLYYLSQGFTNARAAYVQADSVWRATPGADPGEVAGNTYNLAVLMNDLGQYVEARARYEDVLRTWEKLEGPTGMNVGKGLHGLAGTLRRLGDQAEAIPMYERSRAIFIERMPPGHPAVGSSYNNEGNAQRELGNFAAAETLYLHAQAIWIKAYPPGHPELARVGDNLGYVAFMQDSLELAKTRYQTALAAWSKTSPGDDVMTAHVLDNLGEVEHALGDYSDARRDYERALSMRKATLGMEHPDYAQSCDALSGLLADMGDSANAFRYALEAENVGREHLRVSLRGLSEREALDYASIRPSGTDLAISLANAPDRVVTAWDAVIRARSLVLDGISERLRATWTSTDTTTVRVASELARESGALATLHEEGPGDDTIEHFEARVDSARRSVEAIERRLGGLSARFALDSARSRAGLTEVSRTLPPGTALLSYVRYLRRGPHGDARHEIARRIASYAAFVLTPGGAPRLILLGDAAGIDSRVAEWHRQATSDSASMSAGEASYRLAAGRLREAVWDPVAGALGSPKVLYVVPDGSLQLINLGTLPVEGGKYLEETGPVFAPQTCERDLVARNTEAATGSGVLVVGNVDFDGAAPAESPTKAFPALLSSRGVYRGAAPDCARFALERFHPLAQTAVEADETTAAWRRAGGGNVHQLMGKAATETAFKHLAVGCAHIHVASHGFFLGDNCSPSSSGPQVVDQRRESASSQEPNPLRRSGLVFAGANRRGQGTGDDGILTAEEISALDLSKARCAVLSACESGVGDVMAGEGMMGLRRAFQLAGARSLVMSLWRVDDLQTRIWIGEFYNGYLPAHGDLTQAARRASIAMIESRRKNHASTHPKGWGAFVAVGSR